MLPKLKDRIIKQTSLDATNAALVCAAGGFCLGMGGAMLGSLVDIVRNKRNCSSGFTGSELVGFYSGAIAALPLTLAAGALGAALGPFHAVAVCVSRSRYELSKQEQVWFAKFAIHMKTSCERSSSSLYRSERPQQDPAHHRPKAAPGLAGGARIAVEQPTHERRVVGLSQRWALGRYAIEAAGQSIRGALIWSSDTFRQNLARS